MCLLMTVSSPACMGICNTIACSVVIEVFHQSFSRDLSAREQSCCVRASAIASLYILGVFLLCALVRFRKHIVRLADARQLFQ